jgi:hypothetical protein
VRFDLKDYAHVDHGYAATIHKAQGVTVDRAHVLASTHLDRHAVYVGLTRHREGVELHWAREDLRDRTGLERTLSRERAKDTTLDYQAGFAERRWIDVPRGAAPERAKEQRDSVPAHSTAARLEARLAERQFQGQESAGLDRNSAAARLQARLGAERMASIKQEIERSRERDQGLER